MRASCSVGQFVRGVRRLVNRRFAVAIGYPAAGVASDYLGHAFTIESEQAAARARARKEALAEFGAEVFFLARPAASAHRVRLDGAGHAPRRMDYGILPPDTGSLVARSGGDITGAAGRKGKRARAVGAGTDADYKRAQALDDWQAATKGAALAAMRAAMDNPEGATERAQLAAMAADLAELRTSAPRLCELSWRSPATASDLALAGGAGWGAGTGRHYAKRRHGFKGGAVQSSMAGGLARRASGLRGAASDLTHQLTNCGGGGGGGHVGGVVSLASGGLCDLAGLHVATSRRGGLARRFPFLPHDATAGRTGRKADQESVSGAMVPLEQASLEVERAALDAWARDRQGRVFDPGADDGATGRAQRRAVLKWVAGVSDCKASGRTGAAERARFSTIARLVHGGTLPRRRTARVSRPVARVLSLSGLARSGNVYRTQSARGSARAIVGFWRRGGAR